MTNEEVNKYLESIGGLVYAYSSFENPKIIKSRFFECDTGWNKLICDCIQELIDAGWDKEIAQIKEKFGGLRFYPGGCTDKQWEIIRKYEELSYKTCESCGSTEDVTTEGPGWIQSLCKNCRNEEI